MDMLDTFFEKLADGFTSEYGMLGLVLIFFAYLTYMLINRILDGKDKQIEHLAGENKEYRERFTQLIDKKFSFRSKEESDT